MNRRGWPKLTIALLPIACFFCAVPATAQQTPAGLFANALEAQTPQRDTEPFFGRSRRYEGHLSADRATITGEWVVHGMGAYSTVYRVQQTTSTPSVWPLGLGFAATFVVVCAVATFWIRSKSNRTFSSGA